MPLHGSKQPIEEAGPRWQQQGCGHTPSAPAPWWGCPMTAFMWSVLGWVWTLPTSVLGPDASFEWAFAWLFGVEAALRFLGCAFCLISTCIQKCVLQNMFSPVQVELGQ